MLRCIKRLIVDMLGPFLGLIGEDLVENPALGQEAQHVNTSSTKRQRRSRERLRRLLHRATIFCTAMQGPRRIMEKPHGSIGQWSPRQESLLKFGRSGVTPIAFRTRENRIIRGLPIFLRC